MKKYCFIYNPAANRNRSDKQFRTLLSLIENWKEHVKVVRSVRKGEIRSLASKAAREFNIVVACGGDGTASDVAAGLLGTSARLGIIPMGSGNDFAKSVGLPSNIKCALEIIKNDRSKSIDMGKCNDSYFLNTLGFGFDGLTNRLAATSRIYPGSLRYAVAALKANRIIEPFSADIQSGLFKYDAPALMVTFANGRVEGSSFKVAPDASLYDGRLDLLVVQPLSRWLLPMFLPVFVLGKQNKLPWVVLHQGGKYRFRIPHPVPVHADGEIVDLSGTEFIIEAVPSAVEVITEC